MNPFYVIVRAEIDSRSYKIPVNLIDPTSLKGKNICSPIREIGSNFYIDGCTFKAQPTLPPVEVGWQTYNINVEQMLQTVWGKEAKYVALEGFRILPNLNLAYIEITASDPP